MKEVSKTTQGTGTVPSQPSTLTTNGCGSPPVQRELVLYDIVLKNGERAAECLDVTAARAFVRVWNRLPRPEHERARSQAVRWRPVQRE